MLPVALITGASRGIGKAAALKLASEGYSTVITCSRSAEALSAVKKEIETTYGLPCTAFTGDAGDYPTTERLFSSLDSLDVLVNNAGISYMGLIQEMDITDWHRVLNTNLSSCFYTSRLAIPLMLKQGHGKIINVSSVWGIAGASMEAAYSASKGGMNSFTKALAKELAPSNIQVNAVACGVVDTDMNSPLSEEEKLALRSEIPADRFGTAQEAAELIWLIASAPAYMTGQIVTMDGGWC